ncbi:hypothetical protein FB561_4571 [Kribbella amoyensis]|uniref:Peptidase inhibitor family I36 n=1 Tax=Kribbella amoyensis TaxID=996641 RepID=A0A561BX03_9ACTN|nr:hypothetical protein [Kribbella amoyensis]TWD83409.1 hypothetical protein FB561_4571 [Kribbella amoyensis]
MLKRRLATSVVTLGIAVAGLVTVTPAANAATCNSGSGCIYSTNPDNSDSLMYQTAGNLRTAKTVGYYGGFVRNNGTRYPDADHLTVTTLHNGERWRICLHYGPVSFTEGTGATTAAHLQSEETVTGWTWRGECAAGEDRWRRY